MLRPYVQMPVEMPEGHGRPGKFLRVLQVIVPGRFRPFGFSGPGFKVPGEGEQNDRQYRTAKNGIDDQIPAGLETIK